MVHPRGCLWVLAFEIPLYTPASAFPSPAEVQHPVKVAKYLCLVKHLHFLTSYASQPRPPPPGNYTTPILDLATSRPLLTASPQPSPSPPPRHLRCGSEVLRGQRKCRAAWCSQMRVVFCCIPMQKTWQGHSDLETSRAWDCTKAAGAWCSAARCVPCERGGCGVRGGAKRRRGVQGLGTGTTVQQLPPSHPRPHPRPHRYSPHCLPSQRSYRGSGQCGATFPPRCQRGALPASLRRCFRVYGLGLWV